MAAGTSSEILNGNDLRNKIYEELKPTVFPDSGAPFLPRDRLNAIVTVDVIGNLLGRDPTDDLVRWIYEKARVIFLSLEMRNLDTALVTAFRNSGISDESLPIPPNKSVRLPFPHPWQQGAFVIEQWQYLAPVFNPDQFEYELQSQQPWPITKKHGEIKTGTFGSVYAVGVHSAHYTHTHSLDKVAVKELKLEWGQDRSGMDKVWAAEVKALDAMNKIGHGHLIDCIAGVRKGDNRYLMFPWASGGSLRDFWEQTPQQSLQAEVLEQVLRQLLGLADGLYRLHNLRGDDTSQSQKLEDEKRSGDGEGQTLADEYKKGISEESIRHGDLKPENILRFDVQVEEPDVGVLKIADLGLAKRHVIATQDRTRLTTTKWGTILYEAPEAQTAAGNQPRTRLYDIWSMGCIIFEFIIWMLYGNSELESFYRELKGGDEAFRPYFTVDETPLGKRAQVHQVVRDWIKRIKDNTDPGSAVRDLLQLVEEGLLVVDVNPTAPQLDSKCGTPRYRVSSEDLRDSLQAILDKVRPQDDSLTEEERKDVGPPPNPSGTTMLQHDYSLPPLENWRFPVDNAFADRVLSHVGHEELLPRSSAPAKLCDRCDLLNFWAASFCIEESAADLQRRSEKCQFCRMLYGVYKQWGKGATVRFERADSTLKMIGARSLPVLSIVRSPELRLSCPIQLGFPQLPNLGTRTFYQIIKLWLQDCDINHPNCRGVPLARLPTRLIDVGTKPTPSLRLVETGGTGQIGGDDRYVALSHRWGSTEAHPPFCTVRCNLEAFTRAIPYHELPSTFRNAVDITRELGIRYLWIDSLCILQGKDGDFNTEARRMEDVFGCAYCVLAASRATGQHDGFLSPRPERSFVTFRSGDGQPFYVCEAIDDFAGHVLRGGLNRRGWVLQERALARRTVFFTEAQTYFECGEGVRCETMAKMHNKMAEFLGDPKFPDKCMTVSHASRIRYFEELYRMYSRLELSKIEDRPFAIAGLETRLQTAYLTPGRYGIFGDGPDGSLFHRSLLWRRGEDEHTMVTIDFPTERRVSAPTWSWMRYKGGISYMDPPFKKVDWERTELQARWTGSGAGGSEGSETTPHLVATARAFNVAGSKAGEVMIVYDDAERNRSEDGQRGQCVVIARDKEERYYVLIVLGSATAESDNVYTRLGVGFMPGKYIMLACPGIPARVG